MSEEYPLVSILIPSYNHEKYIKDSLDSILFDDYPNKEIIIINDGSKDRSDECIKEWISANKSKITIVYKSRENKGVCKTLNELVSLSSGKYLVPIASDDMLYPGSIKHRVNFLKAHPQKLVLVSDANVIGDNNELLMNSAIDDYNKKDKRRFKDDDGILLSTLVSPQISGPSVMMDKNVFTIIGKYRENLIAEDWYFYQRAAAKKLIIFDDNIAGKYRIHTNNVSGVKVIRSIKMARTNALTYWYNWSEMPSLKYKSIAIIELIKWSMRYMLYSLKIKT